MITVGNFKYSQDEDGNWIYKASDSLKLPSKKKPEYREKPFFKIQYEIEGNSKKRFQDFAKKSVLEITNYLKNINK